MKMYGGIKVFNYIKEDMECENIMYQWRWKVKLLKMLQTKFIF